MQFLFRNSARRTKGIFVFLSFFMQVGKTSLMKRYVANDYTDKRRPTIGADFMTKEIVAGDQPMLLQVNL